MKIKRRKKRADYLYNEHDENQVLTMRKKLKKKKKKRRQRFVFIIVLLLLIAAFFISDLSKIKDISIEGCQKLDETYIKDNISIKSYDTFFFNVSTDDLENEIEKLVFVKKADVSKSLFGNIKITITEDEPVTYCYINDKLYIVDKKGNIQEDNEEKWLSYVQRTPQSMNFDLDNFKEFVKQYVQLPSVVQNQISSLIFEPDEKDQTKCRFELDDGKIFYVRIENMVNQLTASNYYLVMQKFPDYKYYDFLGKNVYVYN